MKNAFYLLLILVFPAVAANAQEYNVDGSKIALQGYSPVSYIDLGLAQRGSVEHAMEYKGIRYFFTSRAQKEAFGKTPEKYLPQYGGWCATGIALGAKFRIDPNKFSVENGKLYLFLNNIEVDALQVWMEKGPAEMARKADKNWSALKDK